jgi:chromate transporter
VSLLLLYFLMLKATVTTLNGPMSLPILRDELVVKHHAITDRELSAAVTAAQSSPGPMGIYVVSVGYFVAGVPGAAAGFLALVTPAFVAIPMIRWIGRRLDHPRAKRALSAAVLASAGLILTSAGPLAVASIHDWLTGGIAVVAFILVATTRIPTVFLIIGAGALAAVSSLLV